MAEPKVNELMEKIVSLCKRRGFIFQSSEIYGGINGFWDYGPLGAELKRNVKEAWWKTMVHQRDDVAGLEATIIMHPAIWKASGHVDTFADMMRECPATKKRVRADQVEPQSGIAYTFLGAISDPKDGMLYVHDYPEKEFGRRAMEDYVAHEKPATSADISLSKLAAYVESRLKPYNAQRSPAELAEMAHQTAAQTFQNFSREAVTVLLPENKPALSAQRKAAEFYEKTPELLNPLPIGWQAEKVTDSIDFHPESGFGFGPARPFNLMFKTHYGPVESDENVAYLRPETAQAIFVQFKNVLETSRQKVPFGIGQIGKAFRNEVTPRNYTFRSREFEQMELEFFIKPDEAVEALAGGVQTPTMPGHPGEPQPSWGWQMWHQYWVEERIRFYESIGLPRGQFEEYWQRPEELAHYARACVDILYKFPFGTQELEGIAARSDFDLTQHENHSGKPMGVFDEELRTAWGKLEEARKAALQANFVKAKFEAGRKKGLAEAEAQTQADAEAKVYFDKLAKGQYIPHVIEPSAGVDRLILALLCHAYSELTTTDDKGKSETRVVLKFHPRIAPIKVGIFPLLRNKPELVKKAQEIRDLVRPHLTVFYDDSGAIGRRYARQDEAGTPFGVTVDFETFEGVKDGPQAGQKDTVTVRDRDTQQQQRVAVQDLVPFLLERLR